MSELSELKEFRRKLVKARGMIGPPGRADGPLYTQGLCDSRGYAKGCYVEMPSGRRLQKLHEGIFYDWCWKVPVEHVRQMYTNSIAALDARIAKLQGK